MAWGKSTAMDQRPVNGSADPSTKKGRCMPSRIPGPIAVSFPPAIPRQVASQQSLLPLRRMDQIINHQAKPAQSSNSIKPYLFGDVDGGGAKTPRARRPAAI